MTSSDVRPVGSTSQVFDGVYRWTRTRAQGRCPGGGLPDVHTGAGGSARSGDGVATIGGFARGGAADDAAGPAAAATMANMATMRVTSAIFTSPPV